MPAAKVPLLRDLGKVPPRSLKLLTSEMGRTIRPRQSLKGQSPKAPVGAAHREGPLPPRSASSAHTLPRNPREPAVFPS